MESQNKKSAESRALIEYVLAQSGSLPEDILLQIPSLEDFIKFDKSGIYYQDFVGYMQHLYKSEYLNINSYGFRGPEFTWKKLDDRYRIIMFGSSALLGWLNADDETISHYLQKCFDNAGLSVEILNLGIRSYKIMNELNLLYRVNLDLDFDAIIIFDGFNDIFSARRGEVFIGHWNISSYLKKVWESHIKGDENWFLQQAKTIRKNRLHTKEGKLSDLISYYSRFLKDGLLERLFPPEEMSFEDLAEPNVIDKPKYSASRKLYKQHVEYFISFAKNNGKKIIFCHQPCLYTTEKDLHQNEKVYFDTSVIDFFSQLDLSLDQFKAEYKEQVYGLGKVCEQNNVQFLDSLKLIDHKTENDYIFRDYCHLTSIGNKLVADEMFSDICHWTK